ncbi:MAG: hypothetical protein ABIT23_09840 [Nitrosospira sp.]
MKLNLSLVLFLLFMVLSSHNANSKEPANSAGGSLQEVAIDLYVDTQTKQIYSEPGAGRVRMGSFQKIADIPAQQTSPAASSGTATTDNGAALKQSRESKQATVSILGNQKTDESPRGFGYANWKERDPFKFNLNEDGSQYIKFGLLNQTWLRYEQNNPGSLVLDKPVDDTTDIGLRRTRLVLQGQLTDRVYFYTQYGMNNFNFLSQMNGNRHIAAYFHDAFGELRLTEGHQAILGGGLTIANGLSRFSNPSAATSMTMDLPIFAQATVDQTDLFSRKLSLYLRGQVGKFNYRVIASDPFSISTTGQPLAPLSPDNATFANNHTKQYQGFFVWNFWDTEPMTNTLMQGTYLGKKSVLNLEAGFITQKNATSTGTSDNPRLHDINFWSVAAYLDAPVDRIKETAISAYLGYFNLDYGPGYIRNNGAMNPASDTSPMGGSYNGPGNAFPMFGTGDVWYGQLGYLMNKDLLGSNNGQLMPYVSLMSANYERLDNQMNVFNVGINWLIKGYTSKITFDYQNRPIFNTTSSGEILKTSSKGQFVLQYQIAF